MFTDVYLCYQCLLMFIKVYQCLGMSLMFTNVYPCLLMFTHVCWFVKVFVMNLGMELSALLDQDTVESCSDLLVNYPEHNHVCVILVIFSLCYPL